MLKVLVTTIVSIFAVLSTMAQAQVLAQVIEMNQKRLVVNDSKVVLVRTHQTPKKVKIKMRVPMRDTVCVRHATRMVTRRDSYRCGYSYRTRRTNCRRQCVRRSTCPSGSPNCQVRCLRYEQRCDVRQDRVANICTFPEQHCVERGVVNVGSKSDKVTLKFKNLPELRPGEEERFVLHARQGSISSSNVKYDLRAERSIQDYIIKVREFFRDRIIITQ